MILPEREESKEGAMLTPKEKSPAERGRKSEELENELRKLIEADFEEATSKIEKSFVEGDREPIKLKDTTGELFSVRIIYV